MRHDASTTNWQELAGEYRVGDKVQLLTGLVGLDIGRVVQVWPSIGMIDVLLGGQTTRFPVEELLRLDQYDAAQPPPPELADVPGGLGTVPVSAGPRPGIQRVAKTWVRRQLKENLPIRVKSAKVCPCPKCTCGKLREASFLSLEGKTESILGCDSCLWMTRQAVQEAE